MKMNIIRQHEANRVYCRHDMQHFLDVARIMYIRVLSGGPGEFCFSVFDQDTGEDPAEIKSEKELIYAAALLHDIGRADQYENGTPHDEAGAAAAEVILADCGFDENEIRLIADAIRGHRGTEDVGSVLPASPGKEREDGGSESAVKTFSLLLKEADKQSRCCFECEARGTCKWPDEKMNPEITI